MHRTLLTTLLCIAVPAATLAPPGTALAQPRRTDAQNKKLAKQYVDAGLAAQQAADYDTALTFFNKAYALVPHPILLFNMAQANRLAKRRQLALELYRRYLEADPGGPQATISLELIAEIEADIAAEEAQRVDEVRRAEQARKAAAAADVQRREDARKAEAARKAAAAGKVEEQRRAEAQRRADARRTDGERSAALAAQSDASASTDSPAPAGRGMRIAGMAMAGAGVVALGTGVFFGLRASSISDELSKSGAQYSEARVAEGKAADRNLIIATAAGGALLVGGSVVYLLGRRKGAASERARISVTPMLSVDGGGIVVTGLLP